MKNHQLIAFWIILIFLMSESFGQQTIPKNSFSELELKYFACFPGKDWRVKNVFWKNYSNNYPDNKLFLADFNNLSQLLEKQKDGFIYQITVQNNSKRKVTVIDWDYTFSNPITGELISRHKFNISETIKPHQKKDIFIFSEKPPTDVISVELLLKSPKNPYLENAEIISVKFESK